MLPWEPLDRGPGQEGTRPLVFHSGASPGLTAPAHFPAPPQTAGPAHSSLGSGHSAAHTVLGLPSIKVSPRANLNTAQNFPSPMVARRKSFVVLPLGLYAHRCPRT